MWNPIWGFDFKVTISKHIVPIHPGQQIAIPVTITKIRGKFQKLDLDVNTNWESMGLHAKVVFDFASLMSEWTGTLFIKASLNTPPNSYLFTVRASTQGTFHTSEDAITVVVEPKDKRKSDKESSEQKPEKLGKPGPDAGESNFNLDNLFVPQSTAISPEAEKGTANPNPNSAVSWIIAIIIGLGIIFGLSIKYNVFDGGGGEGGIYKCTCQNGSICTKNSDCPYMAPGIPGACGCPVH